MKPLTFGSLFAGIGGIDLGMERAGMVCRWQVEIDDYALRVLEKHWPNTLRFRDARECGSHNLPAVDLIAGGFPCQDISNAGKRAGIDGERSGLWREFSRILGELRPRFALVENVPALLGRGFGVVLGDLAALGFDAEWHCIPAAAVGAPHIRDRIFILAYADETERGVLAEDRHFADRNDAGRQEAPDTPSVRGADGGTADVADAERAGVPHNRPSEVDRPAGAMQAKTQERQWLRVDPRQCDDVSRGIWAVEPGVGRVAHGVPYRVDRLRGLGNAVVPQAAEWIGMRIIAMAMGGIE